MNNLLKDVLKLKRKILVVDDEEINRRMLSKILSSEYEVILAEDGDRPIDVRKLISDLRMMLGIRVEYARRKSILLVDDDMDFLQIAYTWFDGVYNVDFVNSAKEAMKYLSEKKPDLILLDHEMPKMNGYEFLSELRESIDDFFADHILRIKE